jgi:hypothetical protein
MPDTWTVLPGHDGRPFAVAKDGMAVVHVVPSLRTCEHLDEVVRKLNDTEARRKLVDLLTAEAQVMGLYDAPASSERHDDA